jgi:hypothetical protein
LLINASYQFVLKKKKKKQKQKQRKKIGVTTNEEEEEKKRKSRGKKKKKKSFTKSDSLNQTHRAWSSNINPSDVSKCIRCYENLVVFDENGLSSKTCSKTATKEVIRKGKKMGK